MYCCTCTWFHALSICTDTYEYQPDELSVCECNFFFFYKELASITVTLLPAVAPGRDLHMVGTCSISSGHNTGSWGYWSFSSVSIIAMATLHSCWNILFRPPIGFTTEPENIFSHLSACFAASDRQYSANLYCPLSNASLPWGTVYFTTGMYSSAQ